MMRARTDNRSGFTLIELMVAIVITSLAFTGLFAAMQTGVKVQIYVREMSDAERVGPAILGQLSEDLRNLYYYNVEYNGFFEGKAFETGEWRTDQLHFFTTRSSLVADPAIFSLTDQEVHAPITEVGWMCKRNDTPEGEGFWELHRREEPFGDDDVTQGGYIRMVCDRVMLFKVQYTGWDFGPSNPELAEDRSVGADDDETASNTNRDEEVDPNNPLTAAGLDGEDDEEDAALVWEDDWSSQMKGGAPVAIKIELIVSPDVDPRVMKRLEASGRIEELEKSYVHVIILPQFREEDFLVSDTFAWDGTIATPEFQQQGVAGGAGGGRGGDVAGGRGGGRGGARGGSRGGGRGGAKPGGGRGGNTNPFGGATGGNRGGANGNPFLNALQGNKN